MTGLWVAVAAVTLAVAFGGYRRLTDGRVRSASGPDLEVLDATALAEPLGPAATFVQFSSEFCAPCRSTARVLAEVSQAAPGVVHVELDAASRLDLVSEFGITRTPTVLLLDDAGAVRHRIVGAVRKPDVLNALAALGAAQQATN